MSTAAAVGLSYLVSRRMVERLSSQRVRQVALDRNESRQVPEEWRGKRLELEQIAAIEGVSVMRVQQITRMALEKLRAVSASDPDVIRLLREIAAMESEAA